MAESIFSIPHEFEDQLRARPIRDDRSDVEILNVLAIHQPVTSEKNVWAFWHSGLTSMPGWCQRNVINWVRLCESSGWTIRVLDTVRGSPNHILNYIPGEYLNEALTDDRMDGPYSGPHSADILRGACLYLYGGVFMDVGILLFRDLDRICWNQLADEDSLFQVAVPWMYGINIANHFVASRKGDTFIQRWYSRIVELLKTPADYALLRHKLFLHLWKNRANHEGLIMDPLLSFAQELDFDEARESGFHWDFKVPPQTVFEYITQVLCWMRVSMLEDAGDGFSGVEYWKKHIMLWDVLPENWGGEAMLGFAGAGQKMFDLLSVKLDANPNTADFKAAYNLVWRLLTQSSMQKITHGKGLTDSIHLGVLWDEHDGRDCEPGTFAQLLRYGSAKFEQTRERIAYVEPPTPPTTLKKGLLEP